VPKETKEVRGSAGFSSSQERTIECFRVRVVEGRDTGLVAESSGVELTIGVARGNHLRLSDPTVSRHHCAFVLTAEGVEVSDLDSTNGTTLGGYRIRSAFAAHGAMVGVGETMLAFEETSEKVSEPLSRLRRFGPVLGQSDLMRRLFALAERVAATDSTVLLEGETGTGKGLFAGALHGASPRAGRQFVVVDCGALPRNLIESELFGHEKGSFTGARATRAGMFEAASGGTVFLDEVGELPLDLQPKLLRVLENREVRRIGSEVRHPVDIRIIAATNRDLRRDVNSGAFRSDLWYRLNTFRLVMPPLRERREDIPLLVARFHSQLVEDPTAAPPPDLVAAMQRGSWPGNVRELRSAVERAVIFDDPSAWNRDDQIEGTGSGPADFDPSVPFRAAKLHAVSRWECAYLEELMRRAGGNLSRAARAAKMDRGHLRDLLHRHAIRDD